MSADPTVQEPAVPEGNRLERAYGLAAVSIALVAAFGVFGEALSATWWLDDFSQRGLFWGELWPQRGALDLHVGIRPGEAAALRQTGTLPWWTHDNFSFSPLRPLTSLLLWWNFSTFDVDPAPYQAVTLGLWIAMVIAVATLYRQLLDPAPALLALVFFVLVRGHGATLVWVAARGLLVSALFGFATLSAYVRWRERGSRWAFAVYVMAFALALGGGEYALCIPGYLFAYEWLRSKDPLARRALCLAPAAALAVLYLGWHVLGRYGVNHGSWYANPLSSPAAGAEILTRSLPSYLAEGFLGLRVPLGDGGYEGWACAALLVAAVGVRHFVPPAGHGRWMFVGALLSCLPCALTLYQPRLVVLPGLGLAAVFATGVFEVGRNLRSLRAQARWLPIAVAAAVLLAHGPVAVWLARRETHTRVLEQTGHRDAALRADLGASLDELDSVFLVNAFVIPIVQTAPLARLISGERLVPWRILSPARGPQRLRRLSANQFELVTLSEGILANPDALAYRSPQAPLHVGDTVRTGPLRVEVRGVDEVSGPTRMVFELAAPVESGRYRFLVSTPQGYLPFAIPPVGESALVPPPFNVDWTCRDRPGPDGRACI